MYTQSVISEKTAPRRTPTDQTVGTRLLEARAPFALGLLSRTVLPIEARIISWLLPPDLTLREPIPKAQLLRCRTVLDPANSPELDRRRVHGPLHS